MLNVSQAIRDRSKTLVSIPNRYDHAIFEIWPGEFTTHAREQHYIIIIVNVKNTPLDHAPLNPNNTGANTTYAITTNIYIYILYYMSVMYMVEK